jgi:hypothetical protein
MSSATIAPVAQALYLCDGHLGVPGGKTDLMGLFCKETRDIYVRPGEVTRSYFVMPLPVPPPPLAVPAPPPRPQD